MDKETRESVMHVVLDYFDRFGSDSSLLELVGWTPCTREVTDAQARAMLAGVLPLLDDERLNLLMRHIAEVLVRGYNQINETEVAA